MTKRHRLSRNENRRGGLATAQRTPPAQCPRANCRRHDFANWHQYIGHLGLHTYADRYCGGDLKKAVASLNLLGIAATDPYPQNGAFAKAHNESARVRGPQ